jgi:peptidoglycan/xylan/chitin deacetylase (PgdA/CDA1 family)
MNQEQQESIIYPPTIRVLQYHRLVSDEVKGSVAQIGLPVTKFQQQLKTLDRWGFTAITFDDYRLYSEGELSLPRKPIVLTFDDGYLDTYELAFPILQEFGMRAVVFVLGDRTIRTNVWYDELKVPKVDLMTDEQILELHQAGFEVGSHGLTHANLTLVSEDKAWEEISRSRMLLEIMLNAPVRTFAYPYGSLNETLKRMVAHAGYTLACSGMSGAGSLIEEPLEICRTKVDRAMGQFCFLLQVLDFSQAYKWVKW